MKKGSVVTVCPECRRVYNFRRLGFTFKKLDFPTGITDVGIECPNCEHFVHSHYLSEELEAMQDSKADRKQRREYKRKFKKLQGWVERKLRNGLSDKSHQAQKDEPQGVL